MRNQGFWTLLAFVLAAIARTMGAADQSTVELPDVEVVEGHPIRTVLPPDAIVALDEPRFATAAAAADFMDAEEQVLGVVVAGVARAYPLALLDWHELVNDQLGGLAIAATW